MVSHLLRVSELNSFPIHKGPLRASYTVIVSSEQGQWLFCVMRPRFLFYFSLLFPFSFFFSPPLLLTHFDMEGNVNCLRGVITNVDLTASRIYEPDRLQRVCLQCQWGDLMRKLNTDGVCIVSVRIVVLLMAMSSPCLLPLMLASR